MGGKRAARAPLTARELAILSIMAALIFASKVALASLPNVNLNSVLIILTVIFFGWKALYTVYVYVLLEGIFFGFSLWWYGYLYAWAVLVIAAMILRKNRSVIIWAVCAGIFGLVFGPLMYIEYLTVMGRWEGFYAMWVAGIPYDITHCMSNFIATLILFKPLYKVMETVCGKPPA